MNRIENVSRRGFLKGLAGAGGFVLGMQILPEPLRAAAAESGSHADSLFKPNVWLAIQESGDLTIVAHRSEMGTGSRTSLPMIIADEMEADWKRVSIEQAIGDEKYGSQNTDGSRSVRNFYQTMRVAGASARQMLESSAAKRWGVSIDECTAKNHFVVHKSGKKLGFGELAKARRGPARAGGKRADFQGQERLALCRHRNVGHGPRRHRHRQGEVRPRREARRHEIREHRALPGGRRKSEVVRREKMRSR